MIYRPYSYSLQLLSKFWEIISLKGLSDLICSYKSQPKVRIYLYLHRRSCVSYVSDFVIIWLVEIRDPCIVVGIQIVRHSFNRVFPTVWISCVLFWDISCSPKNQISQWEFILMGIRKYLFLYPISRFTVIYQKKEKVFENV